MGVGIMNSTAFLLLANSSTEVDENQETELTIESFSILIGHSGLTRLLDSTKPDPSASEPKTVVMLESSEGSSSEVNSPVSLEEAKITEGDNIRENSTWRRQCVKRTKIQRTSPLEVVASPKEYTSYASSSLKQKKRTTTKGSTSESTR
jgi:hypothetical protein